MEEDEKIDYKLHLHKQLDNLVEMGISVYDLEVVNKQAIRSNYILKDKIKDFVSKKMKYLYVDSCAEDSGKYTAYKNILNLLEEK